jgi:hypothetical protein
MSIAPNYRAPGEIELKAGNDSNASYFCGKDSDILAAASKIVFANHDLMQKRKTAAREYCARCFASTDESVKTAEHVVRVLAVGLC